MKPKMLAFAIAICFTIAGTNAKAQYCFWIANESSTTFNEIRVRVNGSGYSFGRDLLPYDYLYTGQHCWIKTYTGAEMWDLQITRRDGTAILFTYKDVAGNWHRNQRYITINARLLHTLLFTENSYGQLEFSYYTTDELDLGHPCDN